MRSALIQDFSEKHLNLQWKLMNHCQVTTGLDNIKINVNDTSGEVELLQRKIRNIPAHETPQVNIQGIYGTGTGMYNIVLGYENTIKLYVH